LVADVKTSCSILILGAAYGSLLATKLALAGHNATVVCLPPEVEAINRDGARIRLPARGHGLIEIDSRDARGRVSASGPALLDPADFDLVALAMQEPQYRAPDVRELLEKIAKARIPAMSIMNMPPLPYLMRIPHLNVDALLPAYTDPTVWQDFDPALMTLCSPDPQAFRPSEQPVNVLQVTLATNFKVACFASNVQTAILRRLQDDIEAVRYPVGGTSVALPVKLKVYDSVFVPLAKWPMLMTGNYRCITRHGSRSMKEAVHTDINESRTLYNWVCGLCAQLGASSSDLVPFEKYADAAESLTRPSSAARALYRGAAYIERVDQLVQRIGAQLGLSHPLVNEIVTLVNESLAVNRQAAA
jgi:hypothetical protein